MSFAILTLGTALMTAPLPPPRPEGSPAPDAELRQLLEEVRQIRSNRQARPAYTLRPEDGAAPAAEVIELDPPAADRQPGNAASPAHPLTGGAPATAPLPPRRLRAVFRSGAAAFPLPEKVSGTDHIVALLRSDPLLSAARYTPDLRRETAQPPLRLASLAHGLPGSALISELVAAGTAPLAVPQPVRRKSPVPPAHPHTFPADNVGETKSPPVPRARPARNLTAVETADGVDLLQRDPPAMGTAPARSALPRTQRHPICNDPRLAGTAIPAVADSTLRCGIAQPVRITAIAGIRLSTPATLDCNTATRFASWLTGVANLSAREHLGSDLDRVWVMGSYACRTRNNRPGGKLSEHARGRAVDIGGFWLKDGRRITLSNDWNREASGRFLAQVRKRACGLFRTVLGPGSDRHHADHFHFDTSPRRGPPYCR